MEGLKALENWAKRVTKGYKDVDVRNMSSSFRDGLAFCAIIHHYRPDLIDFDTLSKGNIFENNQMAFSVAERQLGVPALLDAEDMVKYAHPDRLSIITYLSQLHNCFENQNKVKATYKRMTNNNVSGPPAKVLAFEPKLLKQGRSEVCQVCQNRVFILERLIVDKKLYHTACFRCFKCNCLLNPGAYVESDTPGKYECSVCLPEEKTTNMDTDDNDSQESEEENTSLNSTNFSKPSITLSNVTSPITESVTLARSSFLVNSLSTKSNGTNEVSLPKLGTSIINNKLSSPTDRKELLSNGVSVKDKISAFESNANLKTADPKPVETDAFPATPDLSNTAPYLTNSLSSSPKPSARISLINKISSTENDSQIDNKTVTNATTMDKVDSTYKTTGNIPSISSPSLNCDISPKSTNESSSFDSSISQSQSSSTNFAKASIKSSNSFRSSLGEYKSLTKTPRDIFQTNIQPLKLTIPTINSSKREPTSLPITPLSAESSKTPEISQIKLTAPRSLPRPFSSSNLTSKQKSDETIENDSSTVLSNKDSKETPRRKSLDSEKKIVSDNKSQTLNEIEIKSVPNISSSILKSKYGSDLKTTPTPSIRHSLEAKNAIPHKERGEITKKSELQSITSILTTSSSKKLPQTANKLNSPSKSEVSTKAVNSSSQKINTTLPVKEEIQETYPDDLNPFGDDEPEEIEEYPDDLNPFGDDDEVEEVKKPPKIFEGVSADNYDESKNPFASDEEDAESSISYSTPSPKPPYSHNTSPFGTLSSPTGSLTGTAKKRKAPKPPKLSDIFPTDSNENSVKAVNSTPSPAVSRKSIQTPSPKLRKNKPAPPPPPVPSPRLISSDDKQKSSAAKEPVKEVKKKKRPAPPVPIPMRKDKKKIPLKEIMREMKEIEAKQREFETQGREIELLIRDRDKDEEPSVEEEEYIMQLFELVNQKNALFRRQAELMYIKRSQRLEEQQEELEKQIRQLMQKPQDEKTEEDKTKEEELIYELTDIVDQRNSIIDSIEMDRRRELEEDVSVQEQIEIKNGDLPIAAEIKEKSKGKTKKEKKKEKKEKKNKEKKDKKDKHDDGGDSTKNTLKRKLFK